MSRRLRRLSLLVLGVAAAYFAVPALLLRYGLDILVFRLSDSVPTHEDKRVEISVGPGRSVIVRRYGTERSAGCVVFFPGQHGGISNYEQSLFPFIRNAGATLYAVSYPGHDDAKGRSSMGTLLQDVDKALAVIGRDMDCLPNRTVFIGRSQGATVALASATRFRPKALILEGAAPTLTTAVEAAMRRSVFTCAWTVLPIHWLVGDDYPLVPLIENLSPTPIVLFQGTHDDITPFADARRTLGGLRNVEFIRVEGATHSNAYLVAQQIFAQKLATLFGS